MPRGILTTALIFLTTLISLPIKTGSYPPIFLISEHTGQAALLQVVQQLPGHSRIITTRKYYLSVRPEDAVCQQTIER